MRLLLTNDDGIDSVFLHELIAALSAAGHTLVVVAPRHEQSWVGAGKSRRRPVACEAADRGFGCPTWTVDGTPADCVNIAFAHLLPTLVDRPEFSSADASPDLIDGVVSGINIGLNASLGFILASGTIAGAWEGAIHGLPAVAFSQDMSTALYDRLRANDFRPDPALYSILKISARHAAEMTPLLLNATPLRSFTVHNVNFPVSIRPDSEVRRTVPARVIVPGLFGPAADDGTHRFVFTHGDDLSAEDPTTDRSAVAAGYISHTVLDYRRLGAL